jgi:hypothetical protein
MDESVQNDIMVKIKYFFPNNQIIIKKYKRSDAYVLWFKEHKSVMRILKEQNWNEIKRNITAHLSSYKSTICFICSIEYANKMKRKICKKCANVICIDCYINIFRTNKELIKCPFCRFPY